MVQFIDGLINILENPINVKILIVLINLKFMNGQS